MSVKKLPNSPSNSQSNLLSNPFTPSPKLPVDWLIGAGTVPLLLMLVGGKAIATLVQDAGLASEELFRGDRLPVLKRESQKIDP
jgi:hypothetical protein